ncbi:hypothetical protein D0862_06271, partial [Hortaea werneckii]
DRIQLDYENPAAFWKAFAANLPSNVTGPRNRIPLTRQLLLRTLQFHRTERYSKEERPRLSSRIHNILLWQPCRNYQKPLPPLNREPPIQDLTSTFLTPSDSAYDRNHGILAHLNAETHRIRVDGAVNQTLDLSLSNLHHDFPQHAVVRTIQCAGNRRTHDAEPAPRSPRPELARRRDHEQPVERDPRLRDILAKAGEASRSALPSQATAHYPTDPGSTGRWRSPDSRRRWTGAPLTANHGFPVRVVAPGIAGARAVKWVDRVTVQRGESGNVYMQRDYKVLPPEVRDSQQAEGYWGCTPPVQEMPVNSAIRFPRRGRDSGARGRRVCGGEWSWTEAELLRSPEEGEEGKWAWKLGRARVRVPEGWEKTTVYSRATDKAGNTQPERSQWNLRGVCYNGYGEAADVMIKQVNAIFPSFIPPFSFFRPLILVFLGGKYCEICPLFQFLKRGKIKAKRKGRKANPPLVAACIKCEEMIDSPGPERHFATLPPPTKPELVISAALKIPSLAA